VSFSFQFSRLKHIRQLTNVCGERRGDGVGMYGPREDNSRDSSIQ
jgi:hypothetical protein